MVCDGFHYNIFILIFWYIFPITLSFLFPPTLIPILSIANQIVKSGFFFKCVCAYVCVCAHARASHSYKWNQRITAFASHMWDRAQAIGLPGKWCYPQPPSHLPESKKCAILFRTLRIYSLYLTFIMNLGTSLFLNVHPINLSNFRMLSQEQPCKESWGGVVSWSETWAFHLYVFEA